MKKALASTETPNSMAASAVDAESSELVTSIDVLMRMVTVLGCGWKQLPAESEPVLTPVKWKGTQQYLENRPTLLSFM